MLSRLTSRFVRLGRIPRPLASLPVRRFAGKPGEHPGDEQAFGREAEEIALEELGIDRYDREPATGPFGTMSNPAIIYSTKGERVVGCVGSKEEPHDVAWMNLRSGMKHVCTICGQVFMLEEASKKKYEGINDD
ncbi:hypothetical protein AAMO2058_000913200 [Amorphochlora amoebiformis]|mmetsp:Transcript_24041/g.37824  ORF Transcript_24041/g.37824 Transcript_24041/m.37824 type:complete len:134 (-) Transcript_24041:238-639(-)|eukprot:1358057-Amorphochlora_amoeboformis.AAC.1